MPIPTHEASVGTLVAGRYRLGAPVGRGGVGVVYAAVDVRSGRRVAVKLLHPAYAGNADVTRRFLKEASTSSALADPHVINVLDAGTDAGAQVYLAMEFLEGESLGARLRRRRRALAPAEVLPLLLPLFDTLASAHRRGVVHRDLKPDNIFVSRDASGREVPKLMDFGIAKVLEPERHPTQAGLVLGTPQYMSPEQALGAPDVGPQADVWAMGVVLYECLAGALPHRTGGDSDVLDAIVNDAPVPLAARAVRGVPAALAAAVDGALVRDRARRHATMEAFRDAVRASAGTLAAPGPSSDATARLPALGDVPTAPGEPGFDARAGDPPDALDRFLGRRGSVAAVAVASVAALVFAAWIKAHAPGRAPRAAPRRPTAAAVAPADAREAPLARAATREATRVADASSEVRAARALRAAQHHGRAHVRAHARAHARRAHHRRRD